MLFLPACVSTTRFAAPVRRAKDSTAPTGDFVHIMAIETSAPNKVQTYQLRTQLLSEGRSHRVIASTQNPDREMNIAIKCYASGGENEYHTHLDEDHTFVVLQGAATFQQMDGPATTLHRNGGILIPAGAYYKFEATGGEQLVLLRVGNKYQPTEASGENRRSETRLDRDGNVLHGESAANKHVKGVPIDGAFFE